MSVITECNSSGMCKAQWLREHQIEEKRFYYWQHRFKLESGITDTDNSTSIPSNRFVQLSSTVLPSRSLNSVSATIRKDDVSIDLYDSVSDDLLVKIIKAVLLGSGENRQFQSKEFTQ